MTAGLGPVTLLELLAAAAPARVVAPDLVALVDVARLDLHRHVEVLAVLGRVLDAAACHSRGCSCGQRARLIAAAAVLQPTRGGGTRGLGLEAVAVLALVLHLYVEDVAGELLPDRCDQPREHLEALVLVRDERVDLGE